MPTASDPRVLRWIAAFKLFKASALVASLGLVFKVVREGHPADRLITWALALHVDPNNRYLGEVLGTLLQLDRKHMALLTAATLAYALLFTAEAVGLWLAKRWAAYLTIIATAGFVPVELYEIIERASIIKIVALVINVAIVVYLVFHVRQGSVAHGGPRLRGARWGLVSGGR